MQFKRVKPAGALKTFGTSAFRAAPEAIGNLLSKLGLTNPDIIREAIQGKHNGKILSDESYQKGRSQHPIADIAGSLAGFGPLGLGTSTALRAIPAVGRAVKAAAPSLLKRTAVHGLEGAAQGGLYSPEGQEGEGALIGALLGGGLGGLGKSVIEAFPGARQRGKGVANIEELSKQHEQARTANEQQQDLIDALKKHYKSNNINASPEGIEGQINKRQGKITELEPSANMQYENTENLLPPPEGEELIPHAEKQRDTQLKEISHYLGKDTDVKLAQKVMHSIKMAKQHIQKNYYEPVTEYTDKNYVQLPRTPDVKQIDEELSKISNNPTFKNSPGFEKLKEQLIKQRSGHDLVPATDFVKQWKETKQAASKARRKGFQEGGEDQAYWQEEAMNLKDLAERQLKILEHHLPKQYYTKLLTADKLWREQIAPFYGNKTYEHAKKFTRVNSPNVMHENRGIGMGQEQMTDLLLSHPEITKLALGHTYGKTPEKLLHATEHEQKFINELPQLQGMLERLKGHNRNIDIAKIQHHHMKENRMRAEAAHAESVAQQKERQHAVSKIHKLQKEIGILKSHGHALKKELQTGKITQKEFDHLETKLAEALKTKNSLFKNLLKVAGVGIAALTGKHFL